MRKDTSKSCVGWHSDLAEDEHEALHTILPMNGAFTYVIVEGLKVFLDRAEGDTELLAAIHIDIQYHLYGEARPGKTRGINILIPTELYQRFNAILPEWGATTWFIRRLVHSIIAERDELPAWINAAVSSFLLNLHTTTSEAPNATGTGAASSAV